MKGSHLHSRWIVALLWVAFLWCAPASAAKSTKILVVPTKGESGPGGRFAGWLRSALESHGQSVVSGKSTPLLKKAHVTVKQLGQPGKVRKLGQSAKVGYVVLVDTVGSQVTCTMISVSDGKKVSTLPGSKATAGAAQTTAGDLAAALSTSPAPSPEPAAVAPPVADEPAAAAPPPQDANAVAPMAPPEPTNAPAPTSAPAADEGAKVDATPSDHKGAWRPGLKVDVGALFFQRNATLSQKGGFAAGVTPPCYCGTGSQVNPFFPSVALHVDFFPLAIGGDGSAIEGLGLTIDAFFTSVKSVINTTPSQTVSSFVWSGDAALAYRWVFVDSLISPDLTVQVGYSYFTFPLPNTAFPGINYASPLAALHLHIPLGIEQLVGVVGVGILPKLSVSNSAATVLGTQDGGFGIKARVGLSYILGHWEFGAQGRFELFSVPFSGSTNLTTTNGQQLSAVTLSDRLLSFMITVGFNI